jgi:RimJ/RimL family protein N-acetyltransferase
MSTFDSPVRPAAQPLLVCRLQATERAAVERFFLQEMDEVSLYWRFFRSMTPETVHAYVEQIPFTGNDAVFGAYAGSRLVGVAELAAIPADARCRAEAEGPSGVPACADIGIAVSNYQRRRGIARALMERLVQHAWTRGIKRLQVSTLKANHPMIRLAEAFGFRTMIEQNDELVMHAFRPVGFIPQPLLQAAKDMAPEGSRACEAPEQGTKPGRRIVCPVLLMDRKCP